MRVLLAVGCALLLLACGPGDGATGGSSASAPRQVAQVWEITERDGYRAQLVRWDDGGFAARWVDRHGAVVTSTLAPELAGKPPGELPLYERLGADVLEVTDAAIRLRLLVTDANVDHEPSWWRAEYRLDRASGELSEVGSKAGSGLWK